jgi:hypothetical protein
MVAHGGDCVPCLHFGFVSLTSSIVLFIYSASFTVNRVIGMGSMITVLIT